MRKNRILAFALAAIVGTGLASCSKDPMDANIPNADQKGKFTFVLPAQGGVVTYAGEVAASANEKKLDLTKTSIFMFSDDDNTLEAIIPGTDITAGTNPAGKPTATIEIIDGWEGDKTFYIVGNTDQGAAANLPAAAAIGMMTTTQFQDLITVSQGTTLISSANGLLLAGHVAVTDIEQTPSSDVTLYRSVARFDVDQDITLNKVKIKSIDVINANLNGYIDAYGRGVKTSGLTTGDLNNIAVSQTTVVEDVAGVDHTFQKQESVFYLYPTKLKANNAAGTEILLVGEVNGVEAIYTLNKEASDLVTDCEILANTRYIISAIDVLTHTFTITVAEWDEGEALIGRKDGGNFGLLAAGAITNGTFNATYNAFSVTDPTSAFSAAFTVKGTSTNGVSAQVISTTGVGLIEVGSDVITATAVYDGAGVTYATPYFGYNVTISFDAGKIEADKNFTTIVRLTDVASKATTDVVVCFEGANSSVVIDEETQEEVVLYPTGAGFLPAVKFGNIWWAPVNVGATELPSAKDVISVTGFYYQWGRNVPFLPKSAYADGFPPQRQGTFSYSEAMAMSEFIIAPSNTVSWCSDGGHLTAGWNTNQNTPCPVGWRMPTNEEFDAIIPYLTTDGAQQYNRVTFVNESSKLLAFPLSGQILWNGNGYQSSWAPNIWGPTGLAAADVWTASYRSTVVPEGELRDFHYGAFYGLGSHAAPDAKTEFTVSQLGRSVRCVKDAE